jgi:hypothetical protein
MKRSATSCITLRKGSRSDEWYRTRLAAIHSRVLFSRRSERNANASAGKTDLVALDDFFFSLWRKTVPASASTPSIS